MLYTTAWSAVQAATGVWWRGQRGTWLERRGETSQIAGTTSSRSCGSHFVHGPWASRRLVQVQLCRLGFRGDAQAQEMSKNQARCGHLATRQT